MILHCLSSTCNIHLLSLVLGLMFLFLVCVFVSMFVSLLFVYVCICLYLYCLCLCLFVSIRIFRGCVNNRCWKFMACDVSYEHLLCFGSLLWVFCFLWLMCFQWFIHHIYWVYVCYGLCQMFYLTNVWRLSLSYISICNLLVAFWGVYWRLDWRWNDGRIVLKLRTIKHEIKILF
jgi:hypothetical protein